jgi:spore coat polysaccharide biosynthesis protein SpsF
MKSGILLLGRTDSSRLPGKLMLPVLGRPILEYQIERLKTAKRPDCFVLCTTQLPEDDVLVDLAIRNGLQTFRGNAEDVLDRMIQAARQYKLGLIVSIGGDDVFIEQRCVDPIIECFTRTSADFIYCPDLPVGVTPFGVKPQALERLCQIKTGGTEGWERYFKESGLFQVEVIPSEDPRLRRPELRMTLDYQEDFLFFKAVIEELYSPTKIFPLEEVIALIDSRPDIAALGQKRADEWHKLHISFDVTVKQGPSQVEEK